MLTSIADKTLRATCFMIEDNEGKNPFETPTQCINAATIKRDLKESLG
ncbi:MAG: hypothetical protein KR126chlam4_00600 [Candidatus Anoxychlamydiales bacterium]|uniref:Uncharacterized protein n=1 Tax=marine sediment metagenome TaxID=412755 RepID=A0A0F9CU69_9ZZZZ|nr:hypothetical protein [Candidatus Anoxychlamydiales bacterium]